MSNEFEVREAYRKEINKLIAINKKLLNWVKEQTRFDHPYMPNEVHSIGIEAKELLKEINENE